MDRTWRWTFLSRVAGENITKNPESKDIKKFPVSFLTRRNVLKPRRTREEIRVKLVAAIGCPMIFNAGNASKLDVIKVSEKASVLRYGKKILVWNIFKGSVVIAWIFQFMIHEISNSSPRLVTIDPIRKRSGNVIYAAAITNIRRAARYGHNFFILFRVHEFQGCRI